MTVGLPPIPAAARFDAPGSRRYTSIYVELARRIAITCDVVPPPVGLERLLDWLKVLAEPKRLHILHLLMEGVQCNCELGSALDAPPNLVSHHLRVLREAGLVDVERDEVDARWVYYSPNLEALNMLRHSFGAFFDPARIKPRRVCGPSAAVQPDQVTLILRGPGV